MLTLVLAQLQHTNETDSCDEAAEYDHAEENADKGWREGHRAIGEERQAEVAEDETFSDEA